MRIVFYTYEDIYWSPDTVKNEGSGASESAFVYLAEKFAELGHEVIAYAPCEGTFNGVKYYKSSDYNVRAADILISSRTTKLFNYTNAKLNILWAHDLDYTDTITPSICENIDVIVCGSNWHMRYLKGAYPALSECEVVDYGFPPVENDVDYKANYFFKKEIKKLPKFAVINLGIIPGLYTEVKKKKHKFIWSSMPHKGLLELVTDWGYIKDKWKDATLDIYYGWDVYDKIFDNTKSKTLKWKVSSLINRRTGITWHGKVNPNELAKAFCETDIWYYPPNRFQEVFCNVALEAQAAGCICISRDNGALGEVIGDRGILIPNDFNIKENWEVFNVNDSFRHKARSFALAQTWDSVADKWISMIGEL